MNSFINQKTKKNAIDLKKKKKSLFKETKTEKEPIFSLEAGASKIEVAGFLAGVRLFMKTLSVRP